MPNKEQKYSCWKALPVCLLLFFICLFTQPLVAQINSPFKKDNFVFKGYIKDLQSVYLFELFDNAKTNNIIHNRLAYKWYASDQFTFNWEQRTQFHAGSLVSAMNDFTIPGFFEGYPDLVQLKEDYLNLSLTYGDWRSAYFFTNADRLWLEWAIKDFEIKIGRQRINWGMSLVWNPNDIFNSYDYVDFDYEERPGSDAVYLNYYTGSTGQISFAFQYLDSFRKSTIGLRYQFNKAGYDFQVLAAHYRENPTLGLGWAGNIKNAGFRGEALFIARDSLNDVFLVSMGTEYAFQSGWMVQAEVLYNSTGSSEAGIPLAASFLSVQQSAGPENLSPFKLSLFTGVVIPIHSLLQANVATIVNPLSGEYYGVASASWNCMENFELLFLAQLTQPEEVPLPNFGTFNGLLNLRLKYSF